MAFPRIVANKKRKIGDLAQILPEDVFGILPESRTFCQLQTLEKRIDATIARKKLSAREALSEYPPLFLDLATTISYSLTCSSSDFGSASAKDKKEKEQFLCLRIYGTIVDPETRTKVSPEDFQGFCQFFTKISVLFDEGVFAEGENLVEWIKTEETSSANGIEIKRRLAQGLDKEQISARVFFHLDHNPQQYTCSSQLTPLEQFFGIDFKSTTRFSLLRCLWQYIKTRNLMDPSSPLLIQCDEVLQSVFKCEQMYISDIMPKLEEMLEPCKPHEITYCMRIDEQKGSQSLNMTVDTQTGTDSQFAGWYEKVPSYSQEIGALDESIKRSIDQIQLHKRRFEFLNAFQENPVEMVEYLVANQTRDLHMLSEGDRLLEAQKSTSYYHHTGEWLSIAIQKYLDAQQ